MDRLSLFKVLADGSRYAIYEQLAAAEEPLPTTEISRTLNLHPNTVRLHLEKMRDAGLIEAEPDRHGTVGRPQYRWRVRAQAAAAFAPEPGVEAGGFRLLAHLLAELAADRACSASDVGRREGERRHRAGPADGRAGRRRGATRSAACLQGFMDELSQLGFDPVVDRPDVPAGGTGQERIEVSFTGCPFRELAVLYPDLVCELHRGLSEGVASAAGEEAGAHVRVESFSTLVDEDPCRAELILG